MRRSTLSRTHIAAIGRARSASPTLINVQLWPDRWWARALGAGRDVSGPVSSFDQDWLTKSKPDPWTGCTLCGLWLVLDPM